MDMFGNFWSIVFRIDFRNLYFIVIFSDNHVPAGIVTQGTDLKILKRSQKSSLYLYIIYYLYFEHS